MTGHPLVLLATACVLVQPLLSGTFIQLLIQQATVETIPTATKLLLGGLVKEASVRAMAGALTSQLAALQKRAAG